MSHVIRVIVVDDNPHVRIALAGMFDLYDDLDLAGEADSGEQAIKLSDAVKPDVILMDLMMPGIGGVKAIESILHKNPRMPIVVLSSTIEQEMIDAAIKAGAVGYLFKNVTIDEMASAIRKAYRHSA